MKERECLICKSKFIPACSRQKYCKKEITKVCACCGETFTTICSPDAATVCSKPDCKRHAGYLGSVAKLRTCKICGQQFTPTSSTQEYCNKKIIQVCKVCGHEFESTCSTSGRQTQTCSAECSIQLASINRQASYAASLKECKWCGTKFHPVSNTQVYCTNKHYQICKICGKKFEVDLRKQHVPVTCSRVCTTKYMFRDGNKGVTPEAIAKARKTCLERYGVLYPAQNEDIKANLFAQYEARTGYAHPSRNPQTRKGKNYKHSSIEQLLETALVNNEIEYEHEFLVQDGSYSHSFDYYLPKYKILVDVDGVYYHGYLDDSNGLQNDEDRDSSRVKLVPEDHIFYVVVESSKVKDIQDLIDIIHLMDSNGFSYSKYMFDWCRSIEFPYPTYTESRLRHDYQSLLKYDRLKYIPSCRIGISSVRHFHRSIYSARVGNSMSLVEAWNSDEMLMKAISNRMLYVNNVDPSKILAGFYISKLVPKVSIFNPVLAKILCMKYASDSNQIVDPFSGYSGRLLGACAAGKQYIGSDVNLTAIAESNSIIQFHSLDASVSYQNILTQDMYDRPSAVLLTCPPYNKKEIYNTETEFKDCDGWIYECLKRFKCKKYVFVVDRTDVYASYIVETLSNESHLNSTSEYVVVIDGQDRESLLYS